MSDEIGDNFLRRFHPTQMGDPSNQWPLLLVRVVGASMAPTFEPDDGLVVWRWARCQPGSVVALPDPRMPERLMIKRVHSIGVDGVDVRGDNEDASSDSRHFGPVDRSRIIGRVVYRYRPPERSGRVR